VLDDVSSGKGYAHRLLRMIHHLLNPTNVPWSNDWGSEPTLSPDIKILPAAASYLSSVAPDGFYEKAYLGPDEMRGWVGSCAMMPRMLVSRGRCQHPLYRLRRWIQKISVGTGAGYITVISSVWPTSYRPKRSVRWKIPASKKDRESISSRYYIRQISGQHHTDALKSSRE